MVNVTRVLLLIAASGAAIAQTSGAERNVAKLGVKEVQVTLHLACSRM
jgi:hypothetical protein